MATRAAKQVLLQRYRGGAFGADRLDDLLFEVERTPQGEAICPKCGGVARFHENINGWRCQNCTAVHITKLVMVVEWPEA